MTHRGGTAEGLRADLLSSICGHQRNPVIAGNTPLAGSLAVTGIFCPVVWLVLSSYLFYAIVNTSLSSWGHFLDDAIRPTSKHLTPPLLQRTSNTKHGLITEHCEWTKMCCVLNSSTEAFSLGISELLEGLISSLINLCLHLHHPSLKRKDNLQFDFFCLGRYSTKSSDRKDLHENLGGHPAYLINIFYIWKTQSFPARPFPTSFVFIYIINIHKMNYSSLLFWHFF